MVGRAGLGNPFVYGAIHHFLEYGVLRPEPTLAERILLARRHAGLLTEQYGQFRGVRMMRKHLAWYVRGLPGAATLRARLFRVESLADIDQTFESYLAELAAAP
jgi:tRNA-dihydrouridine synthase